MDRNKLYESILKKGSELGFEDLEVFFEEDKELSLGVFEGEVNEYSQSLTKGISIRGLLNEKMGYAYSEKVDEDTVFELLNQAMDNAKQIDSVDREFIFSGSKEYKEVKTYNPQLEKSEIEDKIKFLLETEKKALESDEKVYKANYTMYSQSRSYIEIYNSKGLRLFEKSNGAYAYLSLIIKDQDNFRTGSSFIVSRDFNDFSSDKLVEEALFKAKRKEGAKSTKSGKYDIVFENMAFASIIQAFMSAFYAESVQKGTSRLKGKKKVKIANDLITLVDDPYLDGAIASASFDKEGVCTKKKNIIEKGVLNNFLYNLKTAHKDGVETTGNANRGSFKSGVSTSGFNVYLQKGELEFSSMLDKIGNGMVITELQGLHAGLNPVSGDFSIMAQGYVFENGIYAYPVSDITVSANYFDILKSIELIANDLKFIMPSGEYTGSPSVYAGKLDISGE